MEQNGVVNHWEGNVGILFIENTTKWLATSYCFHLRLWHCKTNTRGQNVFFFETLRRKKNKKIWWEHQKILFIGNKRRNREFFLTEKCKSFVGQWTYFQEVMFCCHNYWIREPASQNTISEKALPLPPLLLSKNIQEKVYEICYLFSTF